jgi:hypothetical protein
MSASEADRDLLYFTFKREEFTKQLTEFVQIIKQKGLTVGMSCTILEEEGNWIRVGRLYQIYMDTYQEFTKDPEDKTLFQVMKPRLVSL